MATPITELKKLQREIKQLQKRVAKLETTRNRARAVTQKRGKRVVPRKPTATRPLKSNKEIIALLKSKGLIRDLTEQEKKLAAEWRALSPQEKQETNRELRSIRLDQTIAELVAEMRS